jgi:F420-non-reducing hydrogenase iron-sulfur subunit
LIQESDRMETLSEQNAITIFICANCARPGHVPTSAGKTRPETPDFNWPIPVEQVTVPCSGRLQPEHILRAFESGSSVVSVIACQEDNCHHVEGSRRCALRLDYIRSILTEIGLGEERLLSFYLPGSAKQDLALTAGQPVSEPGTDALKGQITAIRNYVLEMLRSCPPNPLREYAEKEESSSGKAVAGGSKA